MASTDRALLANVEVYLAEGNIRRGISGFANNMLAQTEGGDFQERRLLLEPSGSESITSIPGNTATIIRVSKPVRVTCSVHPDTVTQVAFTVRSLFIYTGELGNLTIANEGLLASKVTVLQI